MRKKWKSSTRCISPRVPALAYTCLSRPPAVPIPFHACAYSAYTAYRLLGPALSKLGQPEPLGKPPRFSSGCLRMIFKSNLNDRAICTICAAHVLHIALSNKLIKKITNPGVALPPPGGDTGMSKEREPYRNGARNPKRYMHYMHKLSWPYAKLCARICRYMQGGGGAWKIPPSCAYLPISAPLPILAYLGGRLCLYPAKLLHIVHIVPIGSRARL